MTNTLFDGLLREGRRDPARRFATLPDGRHYSYGDVEAFSARFANVLLALGVRPGDRIAEADLVAELGSRLARFKQPKRVMFVDELPRNTMGKVQKNLLRDQFSNLFSGS